ncbi:hypothetical protein [Erythrobacter oryzae]|uniref:hypothetical protein n=1 Tax=Erythrobacter oryzae TaxID=3019556 RepID=UPI002553D013|nr:hypothetical protein [Erythrobacter sp. COR-2]
MWFLSHTIDPRTGRPQPSGAWLSLRLAAIACWGMAILVAGIAGIDFARWGPRDAQAMWLTLAAIFVAFGYGPHAVLTYRQRRYREAVAAYEAALAGATLPG